MEATLLRILAVKRSKEMECSLAGDVGSPGKSGLHERGEGERVIVLESWARTLEAGERWARLAQARAASRPGLCAIAPGPGRTPI